MVEGLDLDASDRGVWTSMRLRLIAKGLDLGVTKADAFEVTEGLKVLLGPISGF